MTTTWRKEITECMDQNEDSWANVVSIVIEQNANVDYDNPVREVSLDREFDDGYGMAEGDYFALWTHDFVYFPAEYDGSEYVRSAPRNPTGEAMKHGW